MNLSPLMIGVAATKISQIERQKETRRKSITRKKEKINNNKKQIKEVLDPLILGTAVMNFALLMIGVAATKLDPMLIHHFRFFCQFFQWR